MTLFGCSQCCFLTVVFLCHYTVGPLGLVGRDCIGRPAKPPPRVLTDIDQSVESNVQPQGVLPAGVLVMEILYVAAKFSRHALQAVPVLAVTEVIYGHDVDHAHRDAQEPHQDPETQGLGDPEALQTRSVVHRLDHVQAFDQQETKFGFVRETLNESGDFAQICVLFSGCVVVVPCMYHVTDGAEAQYQKKQ